MDSPEESSITDDARSVLSQVTDVSQERSELADEVKRDEEYYFDDVIFLVENHLFRVPRRSFQEESDVFRDMFQLPVPRGSAVDGSSDDCPLRLDGIQCRDFRRLLALMFPSHRRPVESMSSADWVSILKLSTMWGIERTRQQALSALSHQDPVEKIVLANTYNVPEWVVPALNALCQRENSLNVDEGNRLGVDWIVKIAELREGRGYWQVGRHNSWGELDLVDVNTVRQGVDFTDGIRRVFSLT